LKIAINTRLLLKDRLEGIGWFTFETLKRIVTNHPEHEFYFLFDRTYDESFIFSKNVTPIVIGPQARHPQLFKIWFNYSVSKALKKIDADVFLSPDGFLSLKTAVPQIAVIHDLNFEHFPGDLPKSHSKYYRKYFPKFAQKAKRVITVSNFSKQDIISKYNISANKIDVVYNGVNDLFNPVDEDIIKATKKKYTGGKDYFVYVGSLHARKNIERMLSAFDLYKNASKSEVKLVIVGEKIWKSVNFENTLNKLAHKKDIIFTGRVNSNDLLNIIGSSAGLIYVSYFEGFGIPIIEGMKCGIPVVTSDVTSMPEVAGDAAILVDPYSIKSIADGMKKIQDNEIVSSCISKGNKRAIEFNWENTAIGVWNTIEKVLSETN